jgi:hypothetical protein
MVDYELLVELTAEESQAYLARGRVSVDDLARRIARSPEEAWPRRRDDLAPSTDAAFDMWKRSQPAG